MPEQHLGPYQRDIMDQLGCSAEDAAMVEDIMRQHIFHSTLDWLSEAQFRRGAMINRNESLVKNLLLHQIGQPLFPTRYRLREEYERALGEAGSDYKI